ncbi:nucleotide disphospho-sugar-binding domain-containing protein [Nonomuraea sp. NPDC050556]|uniref:nucleotide disphospho-sugar-binding domain-containing protein n=1 Tax=Nonomuraea sp. NPDC050556 TaxID=3364369 RepID=UPI00378EF0CE
MRVVFTTWAWPSHLYALVPLAHACRAAGHEVVFASQPGLTEEIMRAGLSAAVVGTDVDTAGMVRDYLIPLNPVPAPQPGRQGKGPRALEMLLAHTESMAPDLIRLIEDWRADLVVYDQTTLAAPLAAEVTGIPAVRLLYGVDLLQRARAVLPDALAPLAGRFGAGTVDPFGTVTVDPVPASMQMPGDHRLIPMRFQPYNGPERKPWRPAVPRRRPRLCVSWGHTIAKVDPSRFLAGRIATDLALAETDADVVLAISAAQKDLVDVPGSVRVVVDTPLRDVLRDCDAFIGHGGASSILTALSYGLPMALVPQLPDHAGHSERTGSRGAALVLSPADPVLEAADSLLADPGPRKAAEELREEMYGQATPAEVVGALAEL